MERNKNFANTQSGDKVFVYNLNEKKVKEASIHFRNERVIVTDGNNIQICEADYNTNLGEQKAVLVNDTTFIAVDLITLQTEIMEFCQKQISGSFENLRVALRDTMETVTSMETYVDELYPLNPVPVEKHERENDIIQYINSHHNSGYFIIPLVYQETSNGLVDWKRTLNEAPLLDTIERADCFVALCKFITDNRDNNRLKGYILLHKKSDRCEVKTVGYEKVKGVYYYLTWPRYSL